MYPKQKNYFIVVKDNKIIEINFCSQRQYDDVISLYYKYKYTGITGGSTTTLCIQYIRVYIKYYTIEDKIKHNFFLEFSFFSVILLFLIQLLTQYAFISALLYTFAFALNIFDLRSFALICLFFFFNFFDISDFFSKRGTQFKENCSVIYFVGKKRYFLIHSKFFVLKINEE